MKTILKPILITVDSKSVNLKSIKNLVKNKYQYQAKTMQIHSNVQYCMLFSFCISELLFKNLHFHDVSCLLFGVNKKSFQNMMLNRPFF